MKILYFAWLRERIGHGEDEIELPASVATVADLMAHLKTLGPEYDHAFADTAPIRAAIDQAHAEHDAPIGTAREIALFPPMTGG